MRYLDKNNKIKWIGSEFRQSCKSHRLKVTKPLNKTAKKHKPLVVLNQNADIQL